ncbi:SLAP domain-containing protein [Companilactobacillus muriivasis]|uniref:SLAP domain-containing protein n=1 Tax=Companilactobacillus muriivasis TaxID=3081444 RepID=UPI0030C72412
MKVNKAARILSILLCSSLALGNVLVQPVKAVTTSLQPDTTTTPANDANSVDVDDTDTTDDTDTQTVNITFVDQNNNKVVDSQGTPYTFSKDYEVGTEIDPADLATTISSDLNGGYNLDDNQDSITVADSNNNYVLKVIAKTYDHIMISLRDPNGNYAGVSYSNSATVGQKSDELLFSKDVTYEKIPIKDYVFNGYALSHLSFTGSDKIPNSNSDGTLTLTYDMIPEFEKTYQNINYYVLKAIYSVPLDQTITLQHVDDKGTAIPGTTDETLSGYKTGDVIENPYSLAEVKEIPGYTFFKTTSPYVVSGENQIKLIYTKGDINYLTVNYKDEVTGKIIYTDYLRGNSGDTVNIQDIANIQGFDSYRLSNPDSIGDYTLTTNNESINIDVQMKDPFTISIIQSSDSNISLTSKATFEYGSATNNDWVTFLDNNLSNVESFTLISEFEGETNSEQLDIDYVLSLGISDLYEVFNGVLIPGTIINDDSDTSGLVAKVEINYRPETLSNKPINVTYQTTDNKDVERTSLTNDSTDTVDAGNLVKNSLPKGYEFVDSDYIYSINSISDDSVELVSLVKKISDSGNSGGSGNNSGGSNNKPGNVTTINESISTHPGSTDITIYDNNGNATDKTIPANSDFSTTQKMTLNGKTYYRIADNQWINTDDAYIYYDNSTSVKTFSDSAKGLVTSANKAITDRMLGNDSDWYTDRYTYINDQKYYRIATNEWVSANDSFEYKLTNQVVQPSSNAKLYDDRGTFVKNAPSYSLKTDKISTINGVQMYRVATNQWLPATDVK